MIANHGIKDSSGLKNDRGCAITDPKQKVLVIGGSIRGNARRDQTIMRLVKEADGLDDLSRHVAKNFKTANPSCQF